MNALHLHLQELAFKLLQSDSDLDHQAAAWIQKHVKAERHRPRQLKRRKVRLKSHGKAGTFYIDDAALAVGETDSNQPQQAPQRERKEK